MTQSAVSELARRAALAATPEDVVEVILDIFSSHRGNFSKVSLHLFNSRTGLLEIAGSRGISPRAQKRVRLRKGEGAVGAAYASGETVWLSDCRRDPLYRAILSEEEAPRPEESLLCLPLTAAGETLGAVSLSGPVHCAEKESIRELTEISLHASSFLRSAILAREASRDGLTQLFNAKTFKEIWAREMERAREFSLAVSLIMADIDHFKNVNDTHGHGVGDRVLSHVASILSAGVRAQDICGRCGGEEFAVALPDTNSEDAFSVAERLRERVEKTPYIHQKKALSVTVSLGVAAWRPQEKLKGPRPDSAQLQACADEALYASKRNGRNRASLWSEELDSRN